MRGIIADFPTLTSDFLIVNSQIFIDVVGSSIAAQIQYPEAWLSTAGFDHNQIVNFPFIANSLIADAQIFLKQIRNNIMTLGTIRAFGLNAFILTAISFVGLVLANYFSVKQRTSEFSILSALGFSLGQSNRMIAAEGILILGLGLFSGSALGYALTILMRPYISLAVARTLPGMIVHEININWQSVALTFATLTVCYLLATALIIYVLSKSDTQKELRMSAE